jgi:hypothetical protein
MAHVVNTHSRTKGRKQSGMRMHALGHGHPVNDKFKPSVSFQYLQTIPMIAVFMAMVALVWVVAVVL